MVGSRIFDRYVFSVLKRISCPLCHRKKTTNGRKGWKTEGQKDRRTDEQIEGLMEGWMKDGYTDGGADIRINRPMHGWTDGQSRVDKVPYT